MKWKKYFIVLIKWDILIRIESGKKLCTKKVIKKNPLYI